MPDSTNIEKRQAEALSAAIDRLNQGLPAKSSLEESEIAELLNTARLIKAAGTPTAVPEDVLNHIVDQAAGTIAREQRKKRLSWVGSVVGAVAAAAVIAFLYVAPPTTQEQQLAKKEQALPSPVAETQPPTIAKTPPELLEPPPAKHEIQMPTADSNAKQQVQGAASSDQEPNVALGLPTSPVPATSDTMLALADRKADIVTIDVVSKIIRQVYSKGAPDEIILTQAPKQPDTLRSVPELPREQRKMAAVNEAVDNKIKISNRNKVTVIIGDNEVTLEGAVSRDELLKLANTLSQVNIAQ